MDSKAKEANNLIQMITTSKNKLSECSVQFKKDVSFIDYGHELLYCIDLHINKNNMLNLQIVNLEACVYGTCHFSRQT